MASLSKQLMDEFDAEARRASKAGDYERQFIYQNAESLVNNVMHGRAFTEVAPVVRAALLSNAEGAHNTPAEQQYYRDAVELLDLFEAVNQAD